MLFDNGRAAICPACRLHCFPLRITRFSLTKARMLETDSKRIRGFRALRAGGHVRLGEIHGRHAGRVPRDARRSHATR